MRHRGKRARRNERAGVGVGRAKASKRDDGGVGSEGEEQRSDSTLTTAFKEDRRMRAPPSSRFIAFAVAGSVDTGQAVAG